MRTAIEVNLGEMKIGHLLLDDGVWRSCSQEEAAACCWWACSPLLRDNFRVEWQANYTGTGDYAVRVTAR